MSKESRIPYFISPTDGKKFVQMPGMETTILTGLHGQQMMMALNATLPGHSVPEHSHPHKQIGMVYAGMAILRIGQRTGRRKRGLLLYSGQCPS